MNLMRSVMLILALIIGKASVADERHQMKNMMVHIDATEYRNERKIEKYTYLKKDYVRGERSAYNSNRELSRSRSPYVEYPIKAKWAGGEFRVTVVYRVATVHGGNYTPKIYVGFDELSVQETELKNGKGFVMRKNFSFKTKVLRGKNHIVKVWLPSEGVQIDKIEVARKIF